jgi:hypothetical protein
MPAALDWVRRNVSWHTSANLTQAELLDGILRKAWEWLDKPGILEALAETTLILLAEHERLFRSPGHRVSDDPLANSVKRRQLLATLLELIGPDKLGALVYSEAPYARAEDLGWLLDRLETGLPDLAYRKTAALIGSLLQYHTPDATIVSRILDRCGRCVLQPDLILRKALSRLTHPWRLKVLDVEQARDNWRQMQERRRKTEEPVLLDPPPRQRVLNALEYVEQGNWSAWPRLAQELTLEPSSRHFDWPQHLQTQPGWLEENIETQVRIQTEV